MAFSDLRTFIEAAADIGEAKTVEGAHWNLEIGCLTELMAEQEGALLLFDNIAGYPKGRPAFCLGSGSSHGTAKVGNPQSVA